jgi:hypothetical protein
MDKQYPYNNIIENKLQHLPGADADQLWAGMQAILEKKMPQKKERPGFFGWFATGKGLLLIGSAAVLTVCYFFFIHSSSKGSIGSEFEPSNSTISGKTALTNTKENTTAIEKKEALTNTGNVAITKINDKEESNTNNTSSALVQSIETLEYDKSSTLKSAEKNSVADNSTKAGAQNNKPVAKNQHKSRIPITKYGNEDRGNILTKNPNSISSGSLITTSIDFRSALANPTGFSLLSDTIPTKRNGLRDLLLLEAKTGKKIKINNRDKGPYVGIMAGLDLSSVKFKSMKSGNNKGIVAGYSFNKRWSIETGLFWNKKRFFGDGASFSPSNYTLPAGVEMLTVYGNNQMYEWPVNVKFTILPKNHSLFVTAGLSSYYMKTESYEYGYQFNGQLGKSYSSYKNQTKDWLSVANFSLGYTHKLGEIGSIRVEPYLKLPIKDIGINNMPVVSMGFNIGFTRQILR